MAYVIVYGIMAWLAVDVMILTHTSKHEFQWFKQCYISSTKPSRRLGHVMHWPTERPGRSLMAAYALVPLWLVLAAVVAPWAAALALALKKTPTLEELED